MVARLSPADHADTRKATILTKNYLARYSRRYNSGVGRGMAPI